MSLVRLNIYISDINEVMECYTKIQVFRAETQWGSYTEVSTSGTRICLVTDQNHYTFDDDSGSEYYWYKWRYYNDIGTAGPYTDPVQGYTPDVTYCLFEDVKRELRSNKSKGRVRFSENYMNLKPSRNNDNTSTIKLKAVSIHPSYAGEEYFTITFTSVTDFDVTVTQEKSTEPRDIGSGSTASDFTADDNTIRINFSDWSGTAVTDDTVEFKSDSHMSTNDAIRFIQDSEVFVDMLVEENIGYLTEKSTDLRFTNENIPKALKVATAKFAAFFIYSTIYNEQAQPGLPRAINDITVGLRRQDDISTWPKQAMRLVEGYIKKYTEHFNPEDGTAVVNAPRWRATEPLFNGRGVAFVGEGLKLPELDQFQERSSMSYDSLLDWDLMTSYASGVYTYVNPDWYSDV